MNPISFALRRGALITLILVFATALAACSGSSDESQPAESDGGGNGTATVADGAVEITAEGLAFDATTIEASAGEDFTITLVNNDSAPHNISIYTEEGGEALVTGGTAEAGQTVTIDVSALDAGEYYFQCDIHPDMNGSVVVSG
jgi:plastocyanin